MKNGCLIMQISKTMRTKQRILQLSLQLFNERGERVVTTNHIAAELGISPGNLYYHFRNKNEIVKALMAQYQQQTLEMLSLPEGRSVTAQDKIHYFQVLSDQLWSYRFLHRDVSHLVESHQEFKQIYPQFAEKIMQQCQKIYHAFVAQKLMQMSDAQIEALITNLWIILTNWINFLYMSGKVTDANQLDRQHMLQVIKQIIFLESPYLCGESEKIYEDFLRAYPV